MVAFAHALFSWLALLGLFISVLFITPTVNYSVAQNSVHRDPRFNKCDHSALDVDNRSLRGPVRAVLLESSALTWNEKGPRKFGQCDKW